MLKRYARKNMQEKWSLNARYKAWLEVEIAAIKAWAKLGKIPKKAADFIAENASFDEARVLEIEKETKHDLIAFCTNVSEGLGEYGRFIHFGMTSSDCVDTGLALQINSSAKLLLQGVDLLLGVLKKRAYEYEKTPIIGRTHGIHGEITSFGLVLANYYQEISEAKSAIQNATEAARCGMFSGAVGNFAHAPLEFEELACEYLGLKPSPISTQVIPRNLHANVVCAIALLAGVCERIATNIRHMQRSEVYEVQEYFDINQKGSSAMPHKKNPILSENITGLCRIIRSFCVPALENIALWHERDISHSSAERFIFPDIFITADFMITRLTNMLEKLLVYPKNMLKNINLTGGLVYSGQVLLTLPLKGLSREVAYKIVQKNSMLVLNDLSQAKSAFNKDNESLFLNYLLKDEELKKYLSKDEIKACFNNENYLLRTDKIMKRVFS